MRVAVQTHPTPRQLGLDLTALAQGGHTVLPFTREPFTGNLIGFDSAVDFVRAGGEAVETIASRWPHLTLYDEAAFAQNTVRKCVAQTLNSAAQDVRWSDLFQRGWPIDDPHLFVRPLHDFKTFPGQVIDTRSYDPEGLFAHLQARGCRLSIDEVVCVAPVLAIEDEYRFVVIDGEVWWGSTYRRARRSQHLGEAPAMAWDFARGVAAEWLPHPVCVLDVARLADDQLRLVEFNCLNCSGFYGITADRLQALYDHLAAYLGGCE